MNLPQYTRGVFVSELVKIFCFGKCFCNRYAKLEKTPKRYKAVCLKCGYIDMRSKEWIPVQ